MGCSSQVSVHGIVVLEPSPTHIYSDINPIVVNGLYLPVSVDRFAVAILAHVPPQTKTAGCCPPPGAAH